MSVMLMSFIIYNELNVLQHYLYQMLQYVQLLRVVIGTEMQTTPSHSRRSELDSSSPLDFTAENLEMLNRNPRPGRRRGWFLQIHDPLPTLGAFWVAAATKAIGTRASRFPLHSKAAS